MGKIQYRHLGLDCIIHFLTNTLLMCKMTWEDERQYKLSFIYKHHTVWENPAKKSHFTTFWAICFFVFLKTQLKRVKMWQKCFDAGWQPFFSWHPCHPNRDKCKIRVTGVSITKICPSHFDGFFKSEMKTKLWIDQENIETWTPQSP